MGKELDRMSRTQLMKEVRDLQAAQDRTADTVTCIKGEHELILPKEMSYDEAIEHLYRRKEEEHTEVAIDHSIECHPLDGAYALIKAMKARYGWAQLVPTPGFFGSNPPHMVSMQISPTESVQIPWGRMQIPGVDGYIQVNYSSNSGIPTFSIGGCILQKNKEEVHALAKSAEKIVNNESIYHGKALSIKLDWLRNGQDFDPAIHGFKFLDMSGVMPQDLIFNEETERYLNNTLFGFIEHAERCRERHIPLKRGILLEGPYGVGKTLSAYITAKKAIENGWTFILCEDARDLQNVIHLAKRYEPAVIFCEDIDRIVTGDRSISIDEILNTIDGIKSKESELIVVFTTNHVEQINKALLRPGRLDAVLSLGPPNEETVIRLVRHYGRDKIEENEDLQPVGVELDGQIPAVIREVVERAKMTAVVREGEGDMVSCQDLVDAARSMKRHLELLSEKKEEPNKYQVLGETFVEVVAEKVVDEVKSSIEDIVG